MYLTVSLVIVKEDTTTPQRLGASWDSNSARLDQLEHYYGFIHVIVRVS
jgi:hypothetical protein